VSLPVPFSNYGSTRLGINSQKRINLYPDSDGGLRQFPGLLQFGAQVIEASSLSSSIYLYTVSPLVIATPMGLFMTTDGDRLFISGGQTIYQYSLTTNFDISTAVYDSVSVSLPSAYFPNSALISDFFISPNGLKFISLDWQNQLLISGTLSSPWNISTLTYDTTSTLPSGSNIFSRGVFVSSDGLTAFTGNTNLHLIYRYTMTTAWDLSTVSYANDSFDTSDLAVASKLKGISFSDTGTEMRLLDGTDSIVTIYPLTTAYDLSTVGTEFTIATGGPGAGEYSGLAFRSGGRRFYSLDTDNLLGVEYAVGTTGRGSIDMDGVFYSVIGSNLLSKDSLGVNTVIGSILDNPDFVQMETDGTQLVICTGTTIYLYTVAGGLTIITDTSINDTASSSAYGDLRFHYQQPNGQFLVSALNDASDISALDFATAESFSDDLVRVFFHNQLLYLMGQTFSEIWKTTGVGRPPLGRQQVIERGIVGKNAIASIDNKIYFMDQERRINVMSGAQYEPITIMGMDSEIFNYEFVSDAILSTFSYNRENFLEISFPSENTSWTMHEGSGAWCKREGSVGNMFRSVSYVNVYGKTLALDGINGKVYELSESTLTDDGASINRTIDSALITSNNLGTADQKISISKVYIRYQVSGSTVLTVSAAKDGDLTNFTQSQSFTVTDNGILTVHRFPGGVCRECIIRVTTTSNTDVSIIDISVDATMQEDSND
tara:strand:+ start:6152 stop:8299 length:2148 start_codon:yes stop_codon:yes gene_type:complete